MPDGLNPMRYNPAQLKVAILQLVSIVVLVLGFFVVLDPTTEAKYQAVVIAIFSVVGVFAAKNPSADSVNKSLTSLLSSIVGVVNLYATVPTSTVEKLGMLIGVLVPPFLVLINQNAPHRWNARAAGKQPTAV
jgi:drug/metabolite transporter (DMT)-like permease